MDEIVQEIRPSTYFVIFKLFLSYFLLNVSLDRLGLS